MTRQTSPTVPVHETDPSATSALAIFVACAQQMLDPTTSETTRRRAEARLLAQLPVLRALGVFELFQVRDPALAAMLRDELAQLAEPEVGDCRRKRRA